MPPSATALADAVAVLRREAQAPTARAHGPAGLEALLLALLAALLGRLAPMACLAWHPPSRAYHPTTAPHHAAPVRDDSRAKNRLRAWVGWILRFSPCLGMPPSGRAPAPPAPTRTARAPPPPA